MPKKQIGLFSCVSVKEEVLQISEPISDTEKKRRDRLALDSKFFEEERKIVEEINEKILIIENLQFKTKEQEYLLKLMHNIKTFSTQDEYLPAIDSLKQMIGIYVEKSKKIEWEQYESKPLAPPVLTQNSAKTVLLKQTETAELQQDAKKQEIQVKQTPTPSGLGVTDELAKKIAKRRALLDGQDNINTSNVSYSKEAEQSLKVKSINQKNIQNQHSQTLKQALNSDNSPINHGLNVTEELARILAERNKKISERNNNDTTEKDKVMSSTTNVSPDQQSKLSERAADEGQFMQKNVDIDLKQNSDEDFLLLQQIKAARKQLTDKQTIVQEDYLTLEEKKEQYLFNFSEVVCNRTDLSEEERQEIINFHEQVYNVKLRPGNEADKKRYENAVSKIIEISRPNSILDDEFFNNLNIINDFIKENYTQQQQPQTPVSLQFKPNNTPRNKHEDAVEMILTKPNSR